MNFVYTDEATTSGVCMGSIWRFHMLQRRHPVLQSGRCKSMAIRFLLFGMILLLTQEMLPAAQDDAPSATDDLATVFSSIERAWSEGDADAIVARFGERKVLLHSRDAGATMPTLFRFLLVLGTIVGWSVI